MRYRPLILSLLLFFVFVKNCTAQECVILLHALGRTSYSMSALASYLKKSDYLVINQGYPTTRKSIKLLAEENVASMVNQCQQHQTTKINFVTHSVGGIVLRAYLQNHRVRHLGRIVMLAPPNHGSQLADLLRHNLIFQIIAGPAGQELTTDQSSIPNVLNQSVEYPVGVIAGNFSFNPLMKIIFHGDNDGKVAVSSTRLTGMKDFIVLPVSHTFMTRNRLVIQEVRHFLQQGTFSKTS